MAGCSAKSFWSLSDTGDTLQVRHERGGRIMVVPSSESPTVVEIAPSPVRSSSSHPDTASASSTSRGTQVADLFAVLADDTDRWLSVAVRAVNWRLFPQVGEMFLSTSYRPLLVFERDDSPGVHDMLAAPCSADMYAALGHVGYHRSCSENFRTAAAHVNWTPLRSGSVNIFQRTPVSPDGSITALPALTRPGDSVTPSCRAPVYAIVTACSMDEPINGGRCTPLRLEIGP